MNLRELTSLYDFRGKTMVVTVGTGVLGGEIARGLAGLDANAVFLDRNLDPAARLLEYANSCAGCALTVYAGVLSPESLQQASETIMREFGQVDGLVNAAGGNKPEAATNPERTSFDLPVDALRWALELNIIGTVLPCQAFGRDMARRGQGVIVNVSSMNAFRPLTRVPAYSAAKAGVSNFTQWLAVHTAQGYSPAIRVNAIASGFFLTHQNRFPRTDEKTGELTPRGKSIIDHTPMRRFGKPTDVLGTLFLLLSPMSEFGTGVVARADGGFSAFSDV